MQTCAFGCGNSSLPLRAGVNGLEMVKNTLKSFTPRVSKSLCIDLVVFVCLGCVTAVVFDLVWVFLGDFEVCMTGSKTFPKIRSS